MHSRPNHDSHTEQFISLEIKNHPGNSKKVVQLLNYVSTHTEEITRYHAIGMTLHMNSDVYFYQRQYPRAYQGCITT